MPAYVSVHVWNQYGLLILCFFLCHKYNVSQWTLTPNTIPISPTPSSPLRMSTMGDNMERSNLYLKLFKLVFGSVTLFAQENELMLKVSV